MEHVGVKIKKQAALAGLLIAFCSFSAFPAEERLAPRNVNPVSIEIVPVSPDIQDVSFQTTMPSLEDLSRLPSVLIEESAKEIKPDGSNSPPAKKTPVQDLERQSVGPALKSAVTKMDARASRRHKPKIDFDGAVEAGGRASRAALGNTLLLGGADAPENGDLSAWISREERVSLLRMSKNISPAGTALGAVAASPSRENPDYWYHWVRDAGLTMNAVAALYQNETHHAKKRVYLKMMKDYAHFSRANQLTPTLSGLGEPKFNMDGTAFNGAWGRPQDDGPAIRAIALIRFAKALISEGNWSLARELYDGKLPTASVIKEDLEYVSHFWTQTSYDLWEEVRGHHFYTRMLQRKALLSGAELARMMNDPKAADFYEEEAALLKPEIERHWDEEKGIIVETLDQDAGLNYKKSGMDAGVILAILQGAFEDGFFSATDDRVISTVVKMAEVFKNLYPLNQKADAPGIAIGRYPEDRYFGGNPWVISTNTFGQFYLRAAQDYASQGFVPITERNLAFFQGLDFAGKENLRPGIQIESASPLFDPILSALRKEGNGYLETVRRYANSDGSMSEQIDRETGAMISARDLTWNYVSFLREVCEGRSCLLDSFPKKVEKSVR